MKHCVVDKRVAGIIRWLERMRKSYSDGAIESALMDAECARADLENLRNDVWQKVRPVTRDEHRFFHSVTSVLRCVSLSVIVILFSVVPIAKDKVPVQSVKEEMNALISPEPRPIIVIREEEKTETRTANTKPETPPKKSSRRQVTQKKPSVSTSNANSKTPAPQKTVPYDKVFSLVQTGQRALKENTSVISVKK